MKKALLISTLLMGFMTIPCFAQDRGQAQDGNQQMTDMQAVQNIDPNNPYQKNVAEIIKFVDANASMAGAVGACIPKEELDVELCSNMILSKWNDIYGMPIPRLKTKDGKNEKAIIKTAWQHQRDLAFQISANHKQNCAQDIEAERKSPIWTFCKRKSLPENPYKESLIP